MTYWTYPDINPIALNLGFIKIHWYGVAYVAGILLGWLCCQWVIKQKGFYLKREALDAFIPWATLGIIAGGRLGHVLFYGGDYYLDHPQEIFMIWKPGMSFHGGLLGVIAAFYFFAKKHKIKVFEISDVIAVGVPIGIFFGRLANFVNAELVGRITNSPWGMVFPGAGPYPRHPSQLYEAGLEGILLFMLMLWGVKQAPDKRPSGFLSGLFLTGYGVARFKVEVFREPEVYYGAMADYITYGQLLTLPLIVLGVYLMLRARHASKLS